MQLYADLEHLHGLLPIEVVVTDKGVDAALEIMKPILMMKSETTSFLV